MVAVERTFVVRQPLTAVTDYLKDFTNARDWDPGTVDCRREDSGPVRIGSRWTNTSSFMGRTTVLTYQLVTLEPRRLVFHGTNKSATSSDDMTFDATADGTRIRYHAEIKFNGAARLVGPLLRVPFERLANRVVAQMTRVIEDL